ncbi:MAG: PTS sugar transporter subunit IIA [Brevibacillus sp.]|nr:PTS sugar transporter subunit IIA [Brevibacillus sp.]
MKFLNRSLVSLHATATSAEDAIRQAGGLLQQAGLVEKAYLDAMVDSYEKNGPYFVLAPGIAIPHARPEDGVHEACVALLQLKEGVPFGHSANDPVRLVFALGASSSDEHLELLQRLVTLLNDPKNVELLLGARDYQEIEHVMGGESA